MTKVKEVKRTANIAWSPKQQHPIYLAAGTAAQQLDATFSTTAALEIFHVNFANSDVDMPVAGSLECTQRLHKVIWGSHGITSGEYESGIIIGGTDNGHIYVYNAASILAGEANAVALQLDKHNGPVQALDVNAFQENLLASGASDSEIYIWDLRKPDSPLTPGTRTTPLDNISCVHWNKQVQHIMASSSPSGRVVVWDLRKSEPIIKVGDTSAMLHCKSMAWHPEVATQMVIGNEDDRYPVIQLWDLRFATSPVKVMEGHQRGILSLDWCAQDPDLLMSCAKDNRILCWNPNSSAQNGEIVYELPTTSQWCFEVSWCPRNPGVISTASFDGHVTISSVMGGGAAHSDVPDKVASSFGGDAFGNQQHVVQQQQQEKPSSEPLKKPPRWMRRPCGANFAFGGKLITFADHKDSPAKQVSISQVVTEGEFLKRSGDLEGALVSGNLVEFCDQKIAQSSNETETTLWSFLKVNFDKEPRLQFLDLLGYHPQELSKKISSVSGGSKSHPSYLQNSLDADELASKMQLLGTGEARAVKSEGGLTHSGSMSPAQGVKTPVSDNEVGSAFDLIGSSSIDTSFSANTSMIEDPGRPVSPLIISVDEDTDGYVSQALLTGNFEGAVDLCFKADRMAESLILAVAGGPELFARTQKRYLDQARSSISKLISCVVGRDWKSLVETCAIDNWKEALATLVTYGKAEEFFQLCDLLGQRLETEARNYSSAMICYICSGNIEKLVSCWSKTIPKDASPLMLQDLIEKVMILKKAVEREKKQVATSSVLADQLSKYGNILASQGCYETAMVYLTTINDQGVAVIKDRLLQAQGHRVPDSQLPFEKINVRASPAPRPQQQQPQNLPKTPTQPQPSSLGFNQPSPVQPNLPPHSQFYNPTSYTGAPSQNTFQISPNVMGAPTSQTATSSPNFVKPPSAPQPYMQHYQAPGQYQPMPPVSQINQYGYQIPAPSDNQFQPGQGYGMAMPGPPPASDPSNSQPPMSLKASKQETHAPPLQGQNFNLYNPADAQKNQQNLSKAPLTPPGTFVPGQTVINDKTEKPSQPEPEPVRKETPVAPIPAEHMVLQQTFNAMLDRCRSAANNPQTKRKLEDVTRRVESLYDMLRVNKLSSNVLNGLHQISQACQQMNYQQGLQLHTEMVIRGNFSEIGSFMPGLKTLMQIATNLRV